MKKLILTLLLILPFQAYAVLSVLDYTYFLVDENSTASAINNHGEILYVRYPEGQPTQIISSRRGLIVAGSSADINDHGEIVYTEKNFPFPGSNLYSTARGYLAAGNFPSINSRGDVAFSRDSKLWILDTDGNETQQTVRSSNVASLTDSGELIYFREDEAGVRQVYSTTRGVLTDLEPSNQFFWLSANNLGDFVYEFRGIMYGQDGTRLFGLPEFDVFGTPDINNFQDIVFSSFYTAKGDTSNPRYATVLATRRPEFYAQDGFMAISSLPVPEPGTLAMMGAGLFALGVMRRKRAA